VHDSGAQRVAHFGDLWVRVQQKVDEGSRLVAGTGMHDEGGRLVHHDHVVVGVHNCERHTAVGLRQLGARCLRHVDGDRLAERHFFFACRHHLAVERDSARLDEQRGRAATHVGHERDHSVDAHVGERRGNRLGHPPRDAACVVAHA